MTARPLSSSDILELTEQGAGLGSARRALLALEAAYPDHSLEAIAAAPLSARDRALLATRARTLGVRMTAFDRCEGCSEPIELELTAERIGLGESDDPFPAAPESELQTARGPVVIRAVSAADAALAEAACGSTAARDLLAARVAPGAEATAALEAALEALDPAADIELTFACPACGDTTLRAFDVPAFFWRELEARAPRILREVVELARVFHWSEHDILAMSPARRAFYLAEARA